MNIRQLNPSEYEVATALSLNTFLECGSEDFDIQGFETFKNFIGNRELMNELTIFGAFENNTLIGLIGTKNEGTHISLFFIHPQFHRKGIGRKLFEVVYKNDAVQQITVNSSSFAIGFYESMGFTKVMEKQVTNGLGYTPMRRNVDIYTIRLAEKSDVVVLRDLFQTTVLTINSRDYSVAEVGDWASCGNNLSKWEGMLKTHYFIVAESSQSQVVGFSSITPQGYLHSMFVHKDHQGRGIATLLLAEIEKYAAENKFQQITSEVSLTARPFFEKHGYVVEVEQKRRANQLLLTNFVMAKSLY